MTHFKLDEAGQRVNERGFNIGLYRWTEAGSIGASIARGLEQLGHCVTNLSPDQPPPEDGEIVFTFAPYGRWMQIPRRIQSLPAEHRPLLIHWNTEGLPPATVPLEIQKRVGLMRSQLDEWAQRTGVRPLPDVDRFLENRMLRYRYLGDYLRVQGLGIPFLLADISSLYRERLIKLGVPAINVPFGSSDLWYADLDLKRDIDVLWMGSHGSRRRSKILAEIQRELAGREIHFRIIDGRSAPFVHGAERTRLLNRTRIVLNILRTPFDDNTLRMSIAMPNRAMVVSELMMAHNSLIQPGVHYVEAPLRKLADTLAYYLDHEAERLAFVNRAHRLTTGSATMLAMLRRIMEAAELKLGEMRGT